MENRTELRKKIMTILYQISIYDKNGLDYNLEDVIEESVDVSSEYVKDMVYGVVTYKKEIDAIANKYLDGWTIDRLGNTDIAILRMGIYELLYMDTPNIVSINEAIELAKDYSDDSVRKMINGVLDKVYHDKQESE